MATHSSILALLHISNADTFSGLSDRCTSFQEPSYSKNEKAGLKLNIQKTEIMVSSSITPWQIDGGK